MSDFELVTITTVDDVATVTLASEHNRNALSEQLTAELGHAINEVINTSPRSLVLSHLGPAFCAGADLKEAAANRAAGRMVDPRPMIAVIEALMDAPFPTIAAVRGAVRAGGIGLMAACDLSVVATDVTFALTEVRIGVAPAIISVPILRRVAPARVAAAMLTGEPFTASQAADIGLVSHAVEPGDVDRTVAALCAGIAAGGPNAVAQTKSLLWGVSGLDRTTAFERMGALSAELFASDEAAEGVLAFAQKRPPRWVADELDEPTS